MKSNLFKTIRDLTRGEKGMTGLETAIILIAFVTVASVLAYSVLSAGIFSAERGKQTVYSGISQASATLELKGAVIGVSSDNTTLSQIRVKLGLVNPKDEVDASALMVHYFDESITAQITSGNITTSKLSGSTERGSASLIEGDEVWEMVVNIPASTSVGAYDWATLQLVPPSGATLHIKRTMPGTLKPYMNLN